MNNQSRTVKLMLALALAATFVLAAPACKRETRTRPRLPAYKKLVRTDTEVTALQARLVDREMQLLESGDDSERLEAVLALQTEVGDWKEEVTYKLANRYRRFGHRGEMDRLWKAYLNLFPDDRAWVQSYKRLR